MDRFKRRFKECFSGEATPPTTNPQASASTPNLRTHQAQQDRPNVRPASAGGAAASSSGPSRVSRPSVHATPPSHSDPAEHGTSGLTSKPVPGPSVPRPVVPAAHHTSRTTAQTPLAITTGDSRKATQEPKIVTASPSTPSVTALVGAESGGMTVTAGSTSPTQSFKQQAQAVPTGNSRAGGNANTATLAPTAPLSNNPAVPQSQKNSPLALPAVQTVEPSLWDKALKKLPEADQDAIKQLTADKREILQEVLDATKKQREIYEKNKMTFRFRGKDINVREVAEKVLGWVDKFKDVGNVVVQYDAGHAALPWAAVRFLLQVALHDMETMAAVLIGVERIGRLLVRCSVYERLYLNSGLAVVNSLRDTLEGLYAAVLRFLAFSKQYLEKSLTKKLVHALFDAEGKTHFESITSEELQLEKELRVAESELRSHDYRQLEDRHDKLWVILEEMAFRAHVQNRTEILKWLSQVEYRSHHETAKENLLEKTGQWLLDCKELRKWRSSTASSILWLRGIPGAGKTKLTCAVIEYLRSVCPRHEPVVFFYYRNDSPHRDPTSLMQAIVKQLAQVSPGPGLPNAVVTKFDDRMQSGFADGSLRLTETSNLILSLLPIYPQTTIVIDALDESNVDQRHHVFRALETIMASSNTVVKIFISSRDDLDIKLKLEGFPNVYIDANNNSADIERFVKKEVVQSIADGRFRTTIPDDLKQQIISTIVGNANGMFLWADLQIKQLYQWSFLSDIKSGIGKLPTSLENTYSQIWTQICSREGRAPAVAKKALAWIISSRRTLSREIWSEACYTPEPVPANGIDTLFDLCRNLVIFDKQLNRVVYAHLSVQEYFQKILNPPIANSLAAECCLLSLESTTPLRSEFTKYSEIFWIDHVQNSYIPGCPMGREIVEPLKRFFGTPAEPGRAYCKWLRDVIVPHQHSRSTLRRFKSKSPNPFFAVAYFGFQEVLKELWQCDTWDINCMNDYGETILLVASEQGKESIVEFLLDNGAKVDEGRNSFATSPVMAAIKAGKEKTVIKLLDHHANVGANGGRYTTLQEAVAGEGTRSVLQAIVSRVGNIEATEAIVVAAAGNEKNGREIMEILLAGDTRIEITIAGILAIAGSFDYHIMAMLLAKELTAEITEPMKEMILVHYGQGMMRVLAARDTKTEITTPLVMTAAGDGISGQYIMRILLARDAHIAVSEQVVIEAADCETGQDIMEILLGRDTSFDITEGAVAGIASNFDTKMMEIVLANDNSLKITEKILIGAAGNWVSGEGVMRTLLARDSNAVITETILAMAAANETYGKEIMAVLLSQNNAVTITEAVLKAAAGNGSHGNAILAMLQATDPTIEMSGTVKEAIANNWRFHPPEYYWSEEEDSDIE